ncbi:MAG: hypothetical protein V2A62_05495 [Candidatus Woesearchaeota archaeon]
MLERLLRKLLIPVAVGITALTSCSPSADNPSGCLVDSDCLSGRYCRKEEGQKYGTCAFKEDIFTGDVSPEVVGCGNSVCEEGENCSSCPQDCGDCKQLCQPCEGDYQCGDGSGKDMCINFPDSKSLFYNKKKFCVQDCTVDACPTGYDCMDVFSETEKVNKKRCLSNFITGIVPACSNGENCDPKTYTRRCEGNVLHACDAEDNLEKIADCGYYGMNCGFSPYYQKEICFGNSKFGELCPEWYDCDHKEADNCVIVNGGLTTFCSKKCTIDSDCPESYVCSTLDTKEKVCAPQK